MIHVQDLSYTYPKQAQPVIKKLNFTVGEGEILGFLGPSGAGKSTTQQVLIRLIMGYQGKVRILGKSLKKWGPGFYNHIGVGFELPNHYLRLTALENLKLFASFYDKPCRNIHELLDMVGLLSVANVKVKRFSKGMKMRLNFVRALIHDPEIYFFDEPTSGLDPNHSRILKNIILDLKTKGKTIFLTTHRMQDAEELCDRVAFLAEGELKALENPDSLKQAHGKSEVAVTLKGEEEASHIFPLKDIGHNPAFLRLIRHHAVQTIHSQEASLEEIFVKLTGTSLHS